ncbi:MAG: hypothetical protein KBS63_05295 [Clostridiales bacterium]|nr:hypothetical protein [Candidatus Crickella caballi]
MIGRQVILTNRGFTLDELLQFMNENWNTETHCKFIKGRPTPASIEEYILLPATPNYMVIAYPRKAGGIFNKENKVVLSVCDTPEGVKTQIIQSIPSGNAFFGALKIGIIQSKEKERKGPAEEVLQYYTEYMKTLLEKAGYVSE